MAEKVHFGYAEPADCFPHYIMSVSIKLISSHRPHRLPRLLIMIQLRSSVTLYSPLLALDPISVPWQQPTQIASQHLFTYSRSINRSFARHYRTGWRNTSNLLGFFSTTDDTREHTTHSGRSHEDEQEQIAVVCRTPICRAMTNSIIIVCPFS